MADQEPTLAARQHKFIPIQAWRPNVKPIIKEVIAKHLLSLEAFFSGSLRFMDCKETVVIVRTARMEAARRLRAELGYSQNEIAIVLKLNKELVGHYLRKQRGKPDVEPDTQG